jgi:NAD(P)H-hydrate epimerase
MSRRIAGIEEIRAIDRRAQEEFAIPELVLMEGAGLLAWQATADLAANPTRICVLAGRGNNGGDALVMARYACIAGHELTVVLAGDPRPGSPAEIHLRSVEALGASVVRTDADLSAARAAVHSTDLVIDGLAGSGITGPLRAPLDDLARIVNDADVPVVSVDVPSGLSEAWTPGDPIVRASRTLELGLPKLVCYSPAARPFAGTLVQVPIGFPPALTTGAAESGPACELLEATDLPGLITPLDEGVHKGNRGRLTVWGGTAGMSGAAVLAAEAALHARAGLVTIRTDQNALERAASLTRSVMVRDNSGEPDQGAVAVVGPGWGRDPGRVRMLEAVLAASPHGVIDADGLHALAALPAGAVRGLCSGWVLTPHPGELAVLVEASGEQFVLHHTALHASRLAAWTGAVVVAKGPATVIADPSGRMAVVDGMNAALATAGTGDVLAGTIGGLLASGAGPFDAACAAVLAHQAAGSKLRAERGFFLSEELAPVIGKVLDVTR